MAFKNLKCFPPKLFTTWTSNNTHSDSISFFNLTINTKNLVLFLSTLIWIHLLKAFHTDTNNRTLEERKDFHTWWNLPGVILSNCYLLPANCYHKRKPRLARILPNEFDPRPEITKLLKGWFDPDPAKKPPPNSA